MSEHKIIHVYDTGFIRMLSFHSKVDGREVIKKTIKRKKKIFPNVFSSDLIYM